MLCFLCLCLCLMTIHALCVRSDLVDITAASARDAIDEGLRPGGRVTEGYSWRARRLFCQGRAGCCKSCRKTTQELYFEPRNSYHS